MTARSARKRAATPSESAAPDNQGERAPKRASRRAARANPPCERAAVWAAITLLPNPLPELNPAEVTSRTRFLNEDIRLPLLLLTPPGDQLAEPLLAIAQDFRVPLSMGDIAALVDNPEQTEAAKALRASAPDALLFGEIALSQLVPQPQREAIDDDLLHATIAQLNLSGVIIRLDFTETLLGGSTAPNTAGALEIIATMVRRWRLPVLIRSTCGLPRRTARLLVERGVQGFIIAGTGAVSGADLDRSTTAAPSAFTNWGIPTVAAIRMLRSVGAPVIVEEYIETGLDGAKALAIGADLLAHSPPAESDAAQLREWITAFAHELRATMFLTGAARLSGLKQVPFIATGETREWLVAAESLWRADTLGDYH